MAKKYKIIDRVLIGVTILDELLDQTVGAGSRAYHARKLAFWTPPNYKGTNLNQAINRMLRTGYLHKEIVKGEPVLRITRGGKKRLKRDFSYFRMQDKKWDGYWRLVIFDISEKKRYLRNSLRRKLKELGFGMWQKSIYISPFDFEEDIYEFLLSKKLLGMAYVLTARHRLMGDAKQLASQVWPVEKINKEYEKLDDQLKKLETGIEKAILYQKLKQINEDYLQLLLLDPCLPKQLLPNSWYGFKIKKKLLNFFK